MQSLSGFQLGKISAVHNRKSYFYLTLFWQNLYISSEKPLEFPFPVHVEILQIFCKNIAVADRISMRQDLCIAEIVKWCKMFLVSWQSEGKYSFNSFYQHWLVGVCKINFWFPMLFLCYPALFWQFFLNKNLYNAHCSGTPIFFPVPVLTNFRPPRIQLLRFQFFSWKHNGLGINPAISRTFYYIIK